MQKVQMAVTFIMKARAGFSTERAGDMLLSEYLRKVLSEGDDALPSATARREVHLHHVDNFVKLLRGLMNKDPLEKMDISYQAELDKELAEEIKRIRKELPAGLPDAMRDFAESYLSETYIGAATPMIDTLPHMPNLPDDAEASISKMPSELKMKHFAAVYKLLAEK